MSLSSFFSNRRRKRMFSTTSTRSKPQKPCGGSELCTLIVRVHQCQGLLRVPGSVGYSSPKISKYLREKAKKSKRVKGETAKISLKIDTILNCVLMLNIRANILHFI